MKRYNAVLLFFIVLFSLCGCSYYTKEIPEINLSPAPEGTLPSDMPTQGIIQETEEGRIEREARAYLAGLPEPFLPSGLDKGFQDGRLAMSDSGCYLRMDWSFYQSDYIGYCDMDISRFVLWCNRPECDHQEES